MVCQRTRNDDKEDLSAAGITEIVETGGLEAGDPAGGGADATRAPQSPVGLSERPLCPDARRVSDIGRSAPTVEAQESRWGDQRSGGGAVGRRRSARSGC